MAGALMKGVLATSLSAQTATTSTPTGFAVPITAKRVTMLVTPTGTVSSGVVTLEESHDPAYTGTWFAIGTCSPASASVVAVHGSNLYRAVRARISTVIGGGGSITAKILSD